MLQRLGFPDVGPHRRFVSALAIDALGSGIWMPLAILYFLAQTSLNLVEVGTAMTISGLLVVPMVPLIGSFVDRVGPKRVMQTGNALQAVSFALYPFAHSLTAVTGVLLVSTVGRSAFWGALGPMVTQITRRGERELWFGFLQAMRNAGFGVGGVLASVALTIGSSTAYDAVVDANAASYVAAFVLMIGVAGGGAVPDRPREVGAWGVVLRDRGYRWIVLVTFGYALTEMTLNISMPVYFVKTIGLPGWVPGAVFVINTVMIGVGQGLVVRSMTGAIRSRVLLTAVGFTATSFVAMYAAGALSVALAVAVVLVAAVVYTLGEMVAGPVVGALAAEAPPDDLRGRYMSVNQLAWSVSGGIAPLLLSWLLDQGALPLWSGSLALCALWALAIGVLARRLPLAGQPVANQAEVAMAADSTTDLPD
ncbi:MAG: MFS transporter [Nocardioides sp.]